MRFFVFASVLALAACMPQAPQQQQSGAATTTTVASQPSKPGPDAAVVTTPAPAPTPVIDRQFMIGRWGDNGDCTKDIVINADGSFTSYTGGEGQWTLSGETLRLEGKNGTFDMRLALINHDSLRITNPDGSVGTSQRCE
ncbi:MAG: hypothetical protein WAU68_13940 [Vitreimonas sp.]